MMRHQLRSITTRRPRAVLLAVVGVTTLLVAAPAAAGCSPLDELPPVVVPAVPDAPVADLSSDISPAER